MKKALIIVLGGILMSLSLAHADENIHSKRSSRIRAFFDQLSAENIALVDGFYDEKIKFVDPLGEHQGREEMKQYYAHMYRNVKEIRFEYKDEIVQGDTHVLIWDMYMKAEGLNGGDEIKAHGSSVMEFSDKEDKVIYHRDYFDLYEFIYKHVPIVRSMTSMINKKLKGKKNAK